MALIDDPLCLDPNITLINLSEYPITTETNTAPMQGVSAENRPDTEQSADVTPDSPSRNVGDRGDSL